MDVLWGLWQKAMTPRETDVFHKVHMQDKSVNDASLSLCVSESFIYQYLKRLEDKWDAFYSSHKKEVIEEMMKANLLGSFSYEYESVFTSKAIQEQFVKSTLRRVPREKLYWLLTTEEEADIKTYMKRKKEESNE